jgi:hypothetical protein
MDNEKPAKAIINETNGPVKVDTEHCEGLREKLAAAIQQAKAASTEESRKAYTALAEALRRQLQEDGCNDTKFRPSGGDGVDMEPMDI